MKSLLIYFIAICGLAQGCSEVYVGANEPPVQEEVVLTAKNEGQIEHTVQSLPKPGYYRVNFDLGTSPGKYWILRRSGESEVLSIPLEDEIESSSKFVDDDVRTGARYLYELGYTEGSDFVVVGTTKVTIPLDFIVIGDLDLSEEAVEAINHSDRLYLAGGSKIITNGLNFEVSVDEIFSEGASIITLNGPAKANPGLKGTDGGAIRIQANRAEGRLDFVLRGLDGGDGIRPKPLGEAGRGKPGKTGRSAEFGYDHGLGPDSAPHSYCAKSPGNGGTGGKGKTGHRGQDGFSGGNSGSLNIEIVDGANFEIFFDRSPGKGGMGSLGGEGGPGGIGGAAGAYKLGKGGSRCKKAKHGKPGVAGDRGRSGDRGADGGLGEVCLKLSRDEAKTCQ